MGYRAQCPGLGAPGAGNFTVECRSFKRVEKNTLRSFVTLTVAPPGITINDVCLHERADHRWLSLPARTYQQDNTTRWLPIVVIEDREVLRRFQADGLEAIDRYLQQGRAS